MGTGKTAPAWYVECSMMEQFHWTEEDLYEKNSYDRIVKISAYNEVRAEAEKMKEKSNYGSNLHGRTGRVAESKTYRNTTD